ncbi:MAG: hypothetical protein L7T87_02895 [Schleiferiaceae bacterium]|nr:hypothetical protein [Schleiferiaceae bacterium]
MMRYRVFLLSVTALLVSCSTGTQCESSVITSEGLEGNWEIYQRTDTVTMLPAFLQGEDLIITDDSLCSDLQGLWEYRSSNSENGGEFTLDTALQEVIFFTPTYSFRWDYIVVDYNNLVFEYNNGGLDIRELWRRK